MTKSDRSRYWFVRLDGAEEFLRQKCGELASQMDVKAVLAVYHVGDSKENPHIHACIELTSEPQKQSFDVRIKKLFGVEKRSQYSTKVWDGIRDAGAGSYMFHESEAKIVCRKDWSEDDLESAKKHCAAVQKVVAMNRERASAKLVDRALQQFAGAKPSRLEILRYMLTECRDGGAYYPGTFRLKAFVEEVQLKLTDKNDFRVFVEDMEAKLWPEKNSW